jgi:hypothetical protein
MNASSMAPSRERCVVTLDRQSAPRVVHYGEGFLREKLPEGTRVIYPPPPLDPLPNVKQAVRHALAHPEGTEPLFAHLSPGMKIVIGIDDISLPLPMMKTPDVRQEVLEVLVDLLHDYGVDDITMIVALSLHRRMTDAEIRRMVGPRIWREFAPDRLFNHDGADPENMVCVGETKHGERVTLSRYAVEADLVLYVNLNLVPMDGGHKSVGVGFCGYETLQHHHNPDTMKASWSFMDPARSELARKVDRIGKVVAEHLKIFTIETTINNKMYGPQLAFLAKNEDEWTGTDELAFKTLKWTLDRHPARGQAGLPAQDPGRVRRHGRLRGQDRGRPREDARELLQAVQRAREGAVRRPDLGDPVPLPLQRQLDHEPAARALHGAGLLLQHVPREDAPPEGRRAHHRPPALRRVPPGPPPELHRVLPPPPARRRATARSSRRSTRSSSPRTPPTPTCTGAGTPTTASTPSTCWYWGEAALHHVGKVICVGATNQRVAEILGWDTAATIDEALGAARAFLGKAPEVTLLHHPPIVIPDVS